MNTTLLRHVMGAILERGRKPLIVSVVIVGHAMVIILVMHVRPPAKTGPTQFVSTYIVIESTPHATPPTRNATRAASRRLSTRASIEGETANGIPTIPLAPQPRDWQAERERAANESAAHSLEETNSPLLSKPKVIERPRNGTQYQPEGSRRSDGGEIITWISEDCYATNQPPPGPQLDSNRLNIICKKKNRSPQGDLFNHLKPNYLGAPDAPTSKFNGLF